MRWSTLKQHRRTRLWIPAFVLAASCVSPPLESPTPTTTQQTPVRVPQNVKNKVDVLFMVDNSASMDAMTEQLKSRFNQFFQVFTDLAKSGTNADLQIGVVTSDYGAGATGAPGCQPSPGGQAGRLQAGGGAGSKCLGPVGANFIKFDFANQGNANLPANQDLVTTFSCMASVGAQGCGFEHQLESVYAALHNPIPENQGFLRDGALLTVVFLTNEDDASAPPVTDVFDRNKVQQYGYEDSYSRQTRFAIVCGPDPGTFPPYSDSGGPLSDCKAAPNPNASEAYAGDGPGKQFDIQRYIDFFTKPAAQGGVKISPQDVILVGIDAPADPFQVILSNPGTISGQSYQPCGQLNENANPPCVPVLQHSCQNPQQPVFFGDPAVRLNSVINAAANHKISSICDSDYTGALKDLAQLIVSNIGGGCIPAKLPDPANPDCVVEWVTTNQDGSTTINEIPSCTAGPATIQVNGDSWSVCWKLEQKPTCTAQSPDGLGMTIVANDPSTGMKKPAPDNTEASVACSTLAQ